MQLADKLSWIYLNLRPCQLFHKVRNVANLKLVTGSIKTPPINKLQACIVTLITFCTVLLNLLHRKVWLDISVVQSSSPTQEYINRDVIRLSTLPGY